MEHNILIYTLIVLWTFLEGETIVLVSGAAAASGIENIWLVVLFSWIGSFLGDQLWFIMARKYGKKVLLKKPYIVSFINKINNIFQKYGILFIFSYRFLYGIRNFALIVLGLSNLKQKKFLILNFIAAGLWALCFSFIGYGAEHIIIHFFGKHAVSISLFFLGILIIILLIKKISCRKKCQKLKSEMV